MAKTTNYGLYITEASDNPTFIDWRNAMCGSDNSNMQKIDAALNDLASKAVSVAGNPGDFVIIGEDGNLTAITIPFAENNAY